MNAWASLRSSLNSEPRWHWFGDPCPSAELDILAADLGHPPPPLVELLTTFNGAELFIDAMPMVTFFGVGSATNPALDLGIYTKKWRSSRPGNTDWLIGVMNYGGFFVLNSAGLVAEWDSAQPGWLTAPCTPEELTTRLLSEGMDYLCDI